MRRTSPGRRSQFSTDSGNASWTEHPREISSRTRDGALVKKHRLSPAPNLHYYTDTTTPDNMQHRVKPDTSTGVTSPVDSGFSADNATADAPRNTPHKPNQARRRSISGIGIKNHTVTKKGRGKSGDLVAVNGAPDPGDKAFIRRAHTNLTIALRAGRSTQQQQQQATPPSSKIGEGGGVPAKRNSRRRSIDCPYQIWRISNADKSSYGFVPMSGSVATTPNHQQPYGRYNKSVVDPQLTSSNTTPQQHNKPSQDRVAFPPLTSLPSSRGQVDGGSKYKNSKHRQLRPTSYGDGHDRGRRVSSTTLVPDTIISTAAKNNRSTSMDISNRTKYPSTNKRLVSRRNGEDPLDRLQRKDRNKSRSSSIPRASPQSTASAERKAPKPPVYRRGRRASMPVVCVNGMTGDNGISFSSRKPDPLLPSRSQLSPNGIHRKKSTAVSCSTEDYSLPRAEEKLFRTSNTKIVRHPNEVSTPRNEDGIETRFETILEISPNEAIHHFVSGMPDRTPPILSENMNPNTEGSITDELTQANLGLGGDDEEDDEQEEVFRYQRIIDWLEQVQTGEQAEQCVHDVIQEEDDTVSPEFARANAIVVVYDEAKTEQASV